MATEVDAALAEAQAHRENMVDPLEGLRDYERLNLKDETYAEIQNGIRDYERRQDLLNRFIEAAQALIADGYPTLNTREVSISALKDLQDNLRTITAALGKFAANPATSMGLSVAGTEPK